MRDNFAISREFQTAGSASVTNLGRFLLDNGGGTHDLGRGFRHERPGVRTFQGCRLTDGAVFCIQMSLQVVVTRALVSAYVATVENLG